jgi:hypothetical protein
LLSWSTPPFPLMCFFAPLSDYGGWLLELGFLWWCSGSYSWCAWGVDEMVSEVDEVMGVVRLLWWCLSTLVHNPYLACLPSLASHGCAWLSVMVTYFGIATCIPSCPNNIVT